MVATNASGSISFDGLATGLKTNEIVDAMVEAHKAPMRQLDKREEVLKAHKAAYEQVAKLATALDETANSMALASTFVTHEARSSNEAVLRVSAGQGARPGLYTLEVKALATGQRSFSAPQATDTGPSTLSAGTIGWSVNGQRFALDIEAEESLSHIADRINELAGHVSVSKLYDGEAYRLQLTATEVGTQNAVVFEQDDTGLKLSDPRLLVQPAQDATFVLDGVTTIKRSDNVINDVLEGLTFVLEEEGGPVRVKVTQNLDAMGEQIKSFVKAYNEIITTVSGHTRYEGKQDSKKIVGDSTLSNFMRSLQQAVSRPVGGTNDAINALSAIGITTGRDGQLTIDEAKMAAVITNNSAQVTKVFGRDFSRNTPGVCSRVHEVVRSFAGQGTGQLHGKNKSIESQTQAIVRRRAQLQIQADKYEEGLRKQFSDLEKNMSILKSQNSFLEAQANNGNRKN
jgi:flagellar hook-associated protein 2